MGSIIHALTSLLRRLSLPDFDIMVLVNNYNAYMIMNTIMCTAPNLREYVLLKEIPTRLENAPQLCLNRNFEKGLGCKSISQWNPFSTHRNWLILKMCSNIGCIQALRNTHDIGSVLWITTVITWFELTRRRIISLGWDQVPESRDRLMKSGDLITWIWAPEGLIPHSGPICVGCSS